MKNNKKLYYLFGGLLLIAIVGLGVFAGSGYLFKGALTLPKPNPISLPVATKPPAPEPKYSDKGASSAVNTDKKAPTNQDEVFPFPNVSTLSGGSVGIIASSSNPTDEFWFAPSGTTTFSTGLTMTHAAGNATSILAPTKAGEYRLYVRDAAGNYSAPSKMMLTVVVVDKIAPIIAIESPKGGAQTVRATSFTVRATVTDNIGVTKIELHPHGLDSKEVDPNSQIKPNKKIVDYSYTLKLPLSDTAVVPSLWAYDAAGNISKILISIKVENQAPDLSVSLPDEQGNLIKPTDLRGPAESLKLNMKVDATSPHDISRIEFWLDGQLIYNSYNKLNNNKGFFVCPDSLPGSDGKVVEAHATCYLEMERSNGDKISEGGGAYHYGSVPNPIMFTGKDYSTGYDISHTLTIKAYDDNKPAEYQYIDGLGVSEQQIKFGLAFGNGGENVYPYTWIVITP